ncbi:MAG: hypothetical protein ACR2QH_06550 [Geminicoccaceae bacterium]
MSSRISTLMLSLTLPHAVTAEPFTFVALGDMPYEPLRDRPRFDRLIDEVNGSAPAFTLHVGDTKSGKTSCDDAAFEQILSDLNRFQAPLVYTPGDNEWRDCYKKKAGRFDPLERLETLRGMFFSSAESLGIESMPIERQADVVADHAEFVENARFMHKQVMVVTAHIVGWNDKLPKHNDDIVDSYLAREAANIAWAKSSFAKARRDGANALVMAIHADLWDEDADLEKSIHESWARAFVEAADDFGRPVLLIHGDSHTFLIDHPFIDESADGSPLITRLQVYGDEQVQAVRITVDPSDPAVFGFMPIIVREGLD